MFKFFVLVFLALTRTFIGFEDVEIVRGYPQVDELDRLER